MDIYFLTIVVLVIVLFLSLYYIYSNTRHLTVGNYSLVKTFSFHGIKSDLKKKRNDISAQIDHSVLRRPVLLSNNEIGSDDFSGTEDEEDNASTHSCDKKKVSEQMLDPDINILEDEYKDYRSYVDEEELTKCIQSICIFKDLCEYVSNIINAWKNKPFRIAVAGNSGAGKSSLINALRDIRPGDEGAAEVGVVEITTRPVPYTFPKNSRIHLVDLPGMGTINFPRKSYMEVMELRTYDAIIIVTSGRITENDVWLVKEAMQNNKHVLVVRTKIDIDLANAKHDHPNGFVEATCLSEIRNEILKTLNKELKPNNQCVVYLVSSREKNRHDFLNLEDTLKNILNKFGLVIRKMLSNHIKICITEKRELCKGGFFRRKIIALINGIIPGNKYNLSKSLKEMRQVCLCHFCLDDKSLEYVSSEICIPIVDIKYKLKSFDEKEEKETISQNRLLKYFKQISRYYRTLQVNLSRMCDVMAEDEMTLLGMKLDKIEKELSPL